jgi:hypothetical protein
MTLETRPIRSMPGGLRADGGLAQMLKKHGEMQPASLHTGESTADTHSILAVIIPSRLTLLYLPRYCH